MGGWVREWVGGWVRERASGWAGGWASAWCVCVCACGTAWVHAANANRIPTARTRGSGLGATRVRQFHHGREDCRYDATLVTMRSRASQVRHLHPRRPSPPTDGQRPPLQTAKEIIRWRRWRLGHYPTEMCIPGPRIYREQIEA